MIIDPSIDDQLAAKQSREAPSQNTQNADGLSDVLNEHLNLADDLPPPSYESLSAPQAAPETYQQRGAQSNVQVYYNIPPQDGPPVDVKDRSLFAEDENSGSSGLNRSNSAYSSFYSAPGSGPSSSRSPAQPSATSPAPPAQSLGERAHFAPLVLHSRTQRLADGFHSMPPPSDIQPHPFVTRDVRERDWTSFLEAIRTSATAQAPQGSPNPRDSKDSNSGSSFSRLFNRNKNSSSPSLCPAGFPAVGPPTANANATPPRTPEVNASLEPGALVDTWNTQFFHPRGLGIVLSRGTRRLNGLSSAERARLPPDMNEKEFDRRLDGHTRSRDDRDVGTMPSTSQATQPPQPPAPYGTSVPPQPSAPHGVSVPPQPPMPSMPGGFTPPPGPPPGHTQEYYNARSGSQNHDAKYDDDDDDLSDSSSDYDTEDERERAAERAMPMPAFNTQAERRAYRQQLRADRRARRATRRAQRRATRGLGRDERRQVRLERKADKLQEKMERRGYAQSGWGYGAYADTYTWGGRGGPLGDGYLWRGGMGMGRGFGGFGSYGNIGYGTRGNGFGESGFRGPLGLAFKGISMAIDAYEKSSEKKKEKKQDSSRDTVRDLPSSSIPREEGYYRLIVVEHRP